MIVSDCICRPYIWAKWNLTGLQICVCIDEFPRLIDVNIASANLLLFVFPVFPFWRTLFTSIRHVTYRTVMSTLFIGDAYVNRFKDYVKARLYSKSRHACLRHEHFRHACLRCLHINVFVHVSSNSRHLPLTICKQRLRTNNGDWYCCYLCIANAVKIIRKRQRRRRLWTRPWIQRRSQHGAHHATLEAF